MFITSTVVDVKFLDSVRIVQLNDNQFMCIKRSVKFDLAEKQGIIDAARALIGLFRYLLAE
jgi:hypothetical protein